MDNNNKKPQLNFARPTNTKACQSAESNRKFTDLQTNKPRSSRRREQPNAPRNDQQLNSKQHLSAKTRPNVDKRPRQRGGAYHGGGPTCDAEDDVFAAGSGLASCEPAFALANYELNSVYAPGSKKQNLNHLLNFHYAPREADYSVFGRSSGTGGNGGGSNVHRGGNGGKKHKYNKEAFLQANFQFVIKSSAKPKLFASPDTLIDWNLIEQINIQTTEEPQCPICLYPPIAAKMTRCGHAYCWPCILHYLALSDKTWRKCPICYEAIHTADLKSTTIMQQRSINVGAHITFQLMRRKKGSMHIEKFIEAAAPSVERYPQVSANGDAKLFSKFLIAKRADILNIIERERNELIADEDATCPEFVFIQQALDLLKERREKLGEFNLKDEEEEKETQSGINKVQDQLEVVKENIEKQSGINEVENQFDVVKEAIAVKLADRPNIDAIEEAAESAVDILEDNAMALPSSVYNTKYYYFYQSEDGQNIYLHPMNVKMLQACYDTLDRAPHVISARILQQEHHSMDEDHRRKFTCLGHLPLTCQFAVVEVDLQPPMVSASILRLFKDDILYRKKERQRRDRDERKRETRINEINDRQMGKLISSTAQLNLGSSHEFPTCGFEESLLGTDSSDSGANLTAATAKSNRNSASYSKITVWGKGNTNSTQSTTSSRRAASPQRANEFETVNSEGVVAVHTMCTNLSDVLAEAMSLKKQKAEQQGTAAGNKKNKKAKKMLPLFTTGMNYNGN